LCHIDELVARAKELGQPAIAITDHGNMCGVYDLYKECKKQDIQPIYGIEFYHRVEGIEKRLHLIAFAKSMKGLKNLYKLHEISYKNQEVGHFGKKFPIITYDDLFKYKEDLIVTSACLGGHIPWLLQNNQLDEAVNQLQLLQSVFDDDYYIEYQANSIPEQATVNSDLYYLAKELNIKTIITNDTHYILQSDSKVHEMLLCMQTGDKMDNPNRFKFSVPDFWLKSEQEVYQTITGLPEREVCEAIINTIEIMNKCNFEFEIPNPEDCLPRFAEDEKLELRKLATEGFKEKIAQRRDIKLYSDRTKYELNVLEQKGYSGYYLIVSDYINWAKDNGIVVGPGRGSGVGSFLAYLTGMTSINPVPHGLLFERFLNPERMSSPDFDVDFSDRDLVVQYLRERWGGDNISSIIAFGTLTAKAVIRKVLSIHGFSMAQINEISKSLPKNLNLTLKDCEASEVFNHYKKRYPQLFEAMYRLENTIDHTSTHAAGILITPKAISEFAPPLYDSENNILISGFDKYMLEEIGLYKFDILKLETLNVIYDTLNLIKSNEGIDIDVDLLDYEDQTIYNDLCNGNVFGVFQLESQADLTKKLKPQSFEALTALNALIRPGVGDIEEYVQRMNGKEFKYYHDDEKPYMSPTYGTMVYQEQFMLRVNTLAGWTLGAGDKLRKVKNIRTNDELKQKYYEGCKTVGKVTNDADVESSWEEIVCALEGGYSFNKSHACSYAKIAFITAYLKHNYPVYYMAALMTAERDKSEKIAERVNQCRLMGIKILPPDINKSNHLYQVENGSIRYSINTIKAVGEKALNEIESTKPITSLGDLMMRGNLRVLDKRVVENLIKAGCFDFEMPDRYSMLGEYYQIRKDKKIAEAYLEYRQNDMDIARFEKETLGLYLTKSPYDRFTFKPFDEYDSGTQALTGGEIVRIKEVFDKNNKKMAFVTIATQHNNIELLVFANTFYKVQELLKEGNFVMAKGKKSENKLLLNELTLLEG
jgi:DNA polymerase-3 subunit alpha